MSARARELPFGAFVGAYRDRLIGTAALVHLDVSRAPALVDAVLAQLYAAWPRLDDPYAFALRGVLDPAQSGVTTASPDASTFELLDVEHVDARPEEDICSELGALSADERRILVLASYTRLPLNDIAALLGRDVHDVIAQMHAATTRLQDMPRRHRPRRLAAELADAARLPATDEPDTPRAGRAVLRLRRRRTLAVVTAIAVLVVLAAFGIRQALPPPAPIAAAAPAASPTASPPCDTMQDSCRTRLVSTWRAQMAEVISEHLDPKGTYFTGASYSYSGGRQESAFWNGTDGALTVDLYRRDGATEVHLQIANSRSSALRCGQVTRRKCTVLRFMSGDRYNLTDPYDVAHGLEAQHWPEQATVITVVARNTSRTGRQLDVDRAELITLVSDPRLRLPAR